MSLGGYLTGWGILIVVTAPIGWAAIELRRWLLATWRGAWARLVELVGFAFLMTVVGEALGTIGLLRRIPLVITCVAVGIGAVWATRRLPRRSTPRPEPPPPVDRVTLAVAGVAMVGLLAQWLAYTAVALRQGMVAYDTLYYHSPMAARFAQTGYVSRIHALVPGDGVSFYPATTEMWHAIGQVAFNRDIATPFVNLLALAAAFLAAWCIGRRCGSAPAALAVTAVVAGTPYFAIVQPGSSNNDTLALAALLAAAALLSRAPVAGRPGGARAATVFAAAAAGLAAGTKLSFLAPAGLLAIGAVVLAPARRKVGTVVGWAVIALLSGGYWYLRNLVRVGNPLPALSLPGLPSPSLSVDRVYGASLLGFHLPLSSFLDALREYFGRPWLVIVALMGVGIATGLLAGRRSRWHQVVAAVTAIGVVAYLATPTTGDPLFVSLNIRYTVPLQALALIVLVTAPALRSPVAQQVLLGFAVAGLLLSWPGPTSNYRGGLEIGGWPPGGDHRLAAVVLAIALAGLVVVTWGVWRAVLGRLPSRLRGSTLAASAVLGLALVVIAGRGVDVRYEAARYRPLPTGETPATFSGEGLRAAWAWAQGVRETRIGVVGVNQQYPFTGPDSSNYVQYVGVATPHGGFAHADSCRAWRIAVNAGRYRYLVTGRDDLRPGPGEPSEATWTRSDRAAHVILHLGLTTVFELVAPLDPATCR